MKETRRLHQVWANGFQFENNDLLCDICLSYELDEMLMATIVHNRSERGGYRGVVRERHTILLVGSGCWMVEEHLVECNGEDPEHCCQVNTRNAMTIPASFVPVMMRYCHLPDKLKQESNAFMEGFKR